MSSDEGVALLGKYGIKKVPTMILSGDMDSYPALTGIWSQVGTVKDGVYVFQNVEVLQLPFKDLATGQVVG